MLGTLPTVFTLTLAASLPSFRDAALEARCDSLKTFVSGQFPADKAFKAGACGEGNGVGGALYTLDFRLGDHPPEYRLTIAFDDGAPVKVAIKPPLEGLEQAVSLWARSPSTSLTIYGKSYDDFVKGMLAYDGYYPATKGDKATALKFQLVPDKDPKEGRIKLGGRADSEFLRCFDCPDAKCVEDEVRYQFRDRFFALVRKASENFGAGWIIQGPLPVGVGGQPWKFVCGVTRYSLENVEL